MEVLKIFEHPTEDEIYHPHRVGEHPKTFYSDIKYFALQNL